jgi:hypothetical protein
MRSTLSLMREDYDSLVSAVSDPDGLERAAYILCSESTAGDEVRLLGRAIVPIADEHYRERRADRLSIASDSYAAIAKRARLMGCRVLFVHSHPNGPAHHSRQDDAEEPKLMAFLEARTERFGHGSMVVSRNVELAARLWMNSRWHAIERIRILGEKFEFREAAAGTQVDTRYFVRQVDAFGPSLQQLLSRLHVGVVGLGGTGSAVAELLTRLGIGELSLFDGDLFEDSNVSRVYGSTVPDVGRPKSEIAAEHLKGIGLGTTIHSYGHISTEAVARRLRECDIVFGCTDKQAPRGTLVRLSLSYLIPVIDVGVRILSDQGQLLGVYGRITTMLPGEACLFCRGRISPAQIRLEALSGDARLALAVEGYAPELETAEPAVVTFTTGVAAQAVTELIHRLTGFMGAAGAASEVLPLFHFREIGTNRPAPQADCLCARTDRWGRGDEQPYLGLVWREESAAG